METPEKFQKNEKPDSEEESELEHLEAAAENARIAGVYDPSESEGEK